MVWKYNIYYVKQIWISVDVDNLFNINQFIHSNKCICESLRISFNCEDAHLNHIKYPSNGKRLTVSGLLNV